MSLDNNPIIFVGGLPRSGTTLVQNILDSHPEIIGGPEFDRIPNIVDLRRKLINSIETGRIDFYLMKEQVDNSIRKLIEDLLLPTASKYNKKYISEKTPWNIFAFPDLMEIFPEAKFIHVIRDPRSVLSSMLKIAERSKKNNIIPPDFTTNISIALSYFEAVYKTVEVCKIKSPERIITIRYEDLIADLQKETKLLCNFLNVIWSKSMMDPSQKKHPSEEQMTKNEIWYNKESFTLDPGTKKINKPIDNISPLETSFMFQILIKNPYFSQYNYKLNKPRLNIFYYYLLQKKLRKYKYFSLNELPIRTLP